MPLQVQFLESEAGGDRASKVNKGDLTERMNASFYRLVNNGTGPMADLK